MLGNERTLQLQAVAYAVLLHGSIPADTPEIERFSSLALRGLQPFWRFTNKYS